MLGVCAALDATWLVVKVVKGREYGRRALEDEDRRILEAFMKRRW